MAIKRTALLLACAASLAAPCAAAFPPAATKLLCDGRFSRADTRPAAETPVRGIYIDVSANKIRIDGSIAFDGGYLVTQTDERTVGFAQEADPSIRGVLNRLNGDLLLGHYRDSKNRVASLVAECKVAKHMF